MQPADALKRKTYGVDLLDRLWTHLGDYDKGHDPEELHQARLMYKRFQAWLSYLALSGIDVGDLPRSSNPIRALFRRMGRSRDLHIQIALCDGLQSPGAKELKGALQRSLGRLQSGRSCLAGERKELKKAMGRTGKAIRRLDFAAPTVPLAQVMERKLQHIRDLQRVAGSDIDYHRLRRQLKEAWYFLEMEGLAEGDSYGQRGGGRDWALVAGQLKEAEQALGQWHDAAMLLESCARFMAHSPPENLERNRELLREVKEMKAVVWDRGYAILESIGDL